MINKDLLARDTEWEYFCVQKRKKEYHNKGRNDTCPCGSRKKYKNCKCYLIFSKIKKIALQNLDKELYDYISMKLYHSSPERYTKDESSSALINSFPYLLLSQV